VRVLIHAIVLSIGLPATQPALFGQAQNVPAPSAPDSNCAACHDSAEKVSKSAHSGVACASCHLKREEYPHPENAPKTSCAQCHPAQVAQFGLSVHKAELNRGNAAAPNCATCHGEPHEVATTRTPEARKGVADGCGMCHDKEAAEFRGSVHGEAVDRGIPQAPVCTDCHGEHQVLRPRDPRSTVFAGKVPETCGRCHGDVRLMRRFGLPADRITTFESSFHGLALKSGVQSVADCASCHGYHGILASADPKSMTHASNLAKTCGHCHPGAGTRFSIGPVHEVEARGGHWAVVWVTWFYMLLIPGTLGFMLLHHAGDFIRKMAEIRFRGQTYSARLLRPQPRLVHRMYGWERIQHGLLAVSFVVLAHSGFALHYPDQWWSKPFLAWEANFPIRGIVHRTAAVVLLATSVLHVITLIASRKLRHHWMELFPRMSDLREMVEGTLYRVGLRKQKPYISPHSYIEKAEYWALVWGTAVMALSGMLLWFNNWTLAVLPKVWIDAARAVHFYEAVLATGAIVIWHFYSVIFDPDVYPMDPAWITGWSPRPATGRPHDPDADAG
jgi:cytochrome b subunit of formate dehydrogenase